jgi:hypothetical protein
MLRAFVKSCVEVISERAKFLLFFNVVYFCSFAVTVLLAQFLFLPPVYSEEPLSSFPLPFGGEWFVMIIGIFAFNLFLNAFAVVTLPGMLFFPLSTAFLVYRAVVWGLLFFPLPLWAWLAVLPTLVFEGEAYVFAAEAGTVVGLSYFKPNWLFRGKDLSRVEALKMAFKEAGQLYKVVVLLLLVGAIVETATMLLL